VSPDRRTGFFLTARDVVILACAISAGIHGALTPEHFAEERAAGVGFAVSTVALAAAAIAVTYLPRSRAVLAGAAALFLGLIVAYAFAVTTGVPLLHPEREAVDGLALFTKAIEAAGLLAAWSLLDLNPKGVTTWHALHVRSRSS
jgi:hypothetical protein